MVEGNKHTHTHTHAHTHTHTHTQTTPVSKQTLCKFKSSQWSCSIEKAALSFCNIPCWSLLLIKLRPEGWILY